MKMKTQTYGKTFCVHGSEELILIEVSYYPQTIYRLNAISIKIPKTFFTETEKAKLNGKSFELWCWRRLSRVPWTARRYNQSILTEINSEYSLEGLMVKMKLQYFGHLMRRTDSFEKILMLGD